MGLRVSRTQSALHWKRFHETLPTWRSYRFREAQQALVYIFWPEMIEIARRATGPVAFFRDTDPICGMAPNAPGWSRRPDFSKSQRGVKHLVLRGEEWHTAHYPRLGNKSITTAPLLSHFKMKRTRPGRHAALRRLPPAPVLPMFAQWRECNIQEYGNSSKTD